MKEGQPASCDPALQLNRRDFLIRTLTFAGTTLLPAAVDTGTNGSVASTRGDASPIPEPPSFVAPPYQSLSAGEAELVEALVDVMCPADALTPRGTQCGLATFIDRQLAGAFGKGERLYRPGPWRQGQREYGYQRPLTPEVFFKYGLAEAERVCQKQFGMGFAALETRAASEFLQDVADGHAGDDPELLDEWFNELVYPLFIQACFSDPQYGGNRHKVFWTMLGYPGLPAVHGLNIVKYRGKPFPMAQGPASIEDFT